MVNGFFGIYKEKGATSFRIISQLRRITGVKTIGHAGTLDPLASGVLVVAIGKDYTRKISEIVNTEKEYIAKIKLGYESTTDDEEGEKIRPNFAAQNLGGQAEPNQADIEKIIPKFTGKITQTPPIYSALKISGKPMYKLARKGETAETIGIKPREVEVKNIEIIKYVYPYLEIKVTTGKGVYIRALARDIGRELRTGGYLADLERTRVGDYNKSNSLMIDQFEKQYGVQRTIQKESN